MVWVDTLAGQFLELSGSPGIDWSRYDDDGVLLSDPRYSYRDEVLARAEELFRVMGELPADLRAKYRELRKQDDQAALTGLWQSLQQSGAAVWDAIGRGEMTLAADQTLTMTRESYADAIVGLAAYTAAGAYLHLDLVMDDAVRFGLLKLADLRSHADEIVRMCDAFVTVDQHGGLDALKHPEAVSGLGFAFALPVAAWVAISVVGVAAVLGLAYLLHGVLVTGPVQTKALHTCEELAKMGKAMESAACFEVIDKLGAPAAPWGNLADKVGMGIAIAVVLYGASLALPHLMRARRQASAT